MEDYIEYEKDLHVVKHIKSGVSGKVNEICKGEVNKTTKECNGKLYAEKVYIYEPDFNEINALCRFDHPHLLKSAGLYMDTSDRLHLLLPLADGDLTSVIKHELIELDECITHIYHILSAVDFLHSQGYYHCDIKPDNILMFEGKVVVSDFGWVFPMSFNNEHTCGTPTYASPQGWESAPRKGFYNETLNQIQSDIFSIGAIFYECITGYKLIRYKSIDLSSDYDKVEKILLGSIKNETDDDVKLAYECIYKMCRLSQDDRLKTIDEVLHQPIFKNRGLIVPISGRVKKTPIIENMCNFTVLKDNGETITLSRVLSRAFEWGIQLMSFLNITSPLSIVCFITLFYRSAWLIKTINDIQLILCACIYLTSSVCFPTLVTFKKLSHFTSNTYTEKEIKDKVYKVLIFLKGRVISPSIMDKTDNILEIVWWISRSLQDCEFLSKSPSICHSIYTKMESKYPSLISSRIPKRQYIQIRYSKGKIKIQYLEDNVKKIVIVEYNLEGDYITLLK